MEGIQQRPEQFRSISTISLPELRTGEAPQKLRVLVASTGCAPFHISDLIIRRLFLQPNISLKGLFDETDKKSAPAVGGIECYTNDLLIRHACKRHGATKGLQLSAAELIDWADMLVLAPIDTDTLARMLHGLADNLLLEIIRAWDVSKKIILVPGMSTAMWENPMTKKQLNKVRRKWNWIRVLQPMLWHYEHRCQEWSMEWDGIEELVGTVKNQADLMTIGQDVDIAMGTAWCPSNNEPHSPVKLPPEIWSIVFEYLGDWEIAKAVGIYTMLPTPLEWDRSIDQDDGHAFMKNLEWKILTGKLNEVATMLESGSAKWLSSLCVKLIIKFAQTEFLSFLECKFKDIFWASFGHTLLPTKASAVFGKVEVLEWWRTSPSFLTKEYNHEAIDTASKAGFVHVLDWWRKSGLPLRYTEAALEQASSKGNIDVLEWWKAASMHQGRYHIESETSKYGATRGRHHMAMHYSNRFDVDLKEGPLPLKVGKSICFAAQNGQLETVQWWNASGIPCSHEETVAKIASTNGHVNVLQLWKELKGEKMVFDNQVLVGPTKNGHRNVLEWWKNSGFRVEYKTCDIEEALEDSLGGVGEDQVKIWWAWNGLNLGVGTSEWMKVKVL
ncbi:MAG: hypothetical protein M1827_007667 [Pycnora praestabilis]|nr:MAG: hypothetical protein M1827_007667 [Pycnora praestabilis]